MFNLKINFDPYLVLIMTYKETLEFLYSQLPAYHRIGKAAYKNNLDNTLALDNHLGNPHLNFGSIHIAGTNGKGSVSHMTASILQEAGYKTGLYTSPHLRDFRERIRINGEMISGNEVVGFVKRNHIIIGEVKPSFFEMTVAMAYDYFSMQKVDIAVIETGLGGRLDSTNIINPVLSVITNIGHDHMDLLGDTVEKIATEKAGIIKEGVPVVIGETAVETADLFISKADTMQSVISFADSEFTCNLGNDMATAERKYKITENSTGQSFEGMIPLAGDYQVKNIVTVFGIFKALREKLNITEEIIIGGIKNVVKNTRLEGRWQILSENPLTICDTGHNREGIMFVAKQLSRFSGRNLHMVIGFVKDKDLSAVLPLFPKNASYYFCKASVERAMDEKLLRQKASEFGLFGESYPEVRAALMAAREIASKADVIFIGGSTFVVGDCLS